ncbi:universal stress protein [Aquimarina muelleri]|uniref:Universal stress protein UspA n=1 Tax=Aquimarina muelleri TaxID=279356 RepID=A0A918JU84_9FLAO|nr:universal stress protein [Aquimarina muelleri]MCX2763911.1 universal stress protein [Aquimarina muelleri]GGX11079.1 universal stress protein UspA [Aquimarina muelleri]
MKNIIIPVDFSKQSEFALKAGAILAKKHDAVLYILHMLELSDSIISHSETDNKNEMLFMLALAKKKFAPFLGKEYLEGVKVKTMIKHHKVYKEVDLVAKEVDADLIIMGSHGLTAQDGIFAGSNAEKMVRNSKTPVLIIKSEPKEFELKNVVIATDLNPQNTSVFSQKVAIFSALGSTIHPVYVNLPNNNFTSSKEFKEKVRVFAAAGGSNKVKFIAGYTVEDGLIQYAEETNADLIAVSTHARKGLNHFLKGSISEDLANHAKLPVMTFKL